jgi:hypothetical protein
MYAQGNSNLACFAFDRNKSESLIYAGADNRY